MFRPIGNIDSECAAFSAAVDDLRRRGEPILIYPGCGDTPARGFLNLDIAFHEKLTPDDPRWEDRQIFIFPFADMA